MRVFDVDVCPSIHLCPVAADALIVLKVAADDARARTTKRERCKVMSLLSNSFTVLVAIAVGHLGKSFNPTTHTRQHCNPLVVRQFNRLAHL